MNKLTYSLVLLLGISFFIQNHASESFENDTKVRLTIHNVGVGQCYDLEMYDSLKKKKKYMLIGFGIEESQFKDPSPESVSISSGRSKVHLTPSDYRAPSPTRPLSSQELVKELRAKFKQENGVGEGIEVDTVILTHPMKDRGLLMDLFSYETDRLGQLWLAGLPEQYYEDKQDKFRSWLEAKKLKKTEIYFLAVDKEIPGSIYSKENRKYKQAYFTLPVEDGEKKLNFGAIKVSFLSVNPTHFQGYGRTSFVGSQEVLRSCFPEDTHSDSLLIKIRNGSTSVLLTGNATSLTTNRALNNYIDDPKSLQSNVLVASSYGSTFQGANDLEWLSKVNPEYVLISHGSSSLTLDQKAYDSFKELKRLKNPVTLHDIQVQVPQVQNYSINHAIFSTLNSGTITVDLYKKRLTVRTEKEEEISQPSVKGSLEKQDSLLIRRPDHHSHSLLFSASSSPNAKSSPKIVSQKREYDGFSDYDNVSSSPQIKKIREKDLPRPQSLSLIQEKDSARKEHHRKTPKNKTEKHPVKVPSKEIDTEVPAPRLLSVRTDDRYIYNDHHPSSDENDLNRNTRNSNRIDVSDLIERWTRKTSMDSSSENSGSSDDSYL